MPSPTASPTATPTPAPATDPVLAGYAPLLEEALAGMDFVRDGLNAEEKNVLDWADGRLFSNPAFLASKWGPDKWPSEVKTASVQAIPMLMLEIDIEKRSDGKHVITWGVDSLDRVLDDLGIYEGVCVSCYGKDNYASVDEVRKNQYPIVNDQKHVHREMLKTFAYFAEADGEGILMRSLMENDADDLEMLYRRVLPVERMFTHSSFAWQNQSFMSQITLPDGTLESFPTTVYKIIGNAATQRDAAERWFDHINEVLVHFTGGTAEFANLFRPYSQTPYTPEPGYILLVGEAGSPSSTGLTVSAFRSIGLKAEQFYSPENGYRTGGVEIDGEWFYHDGNFPLHRRDHWMCVFFAPLDVVENREWDEHCGYKGSIAVGGSVSGEIIGEKADVFSVTYAAGVAYRIRGRGAVSGGGTLTSLMVSTCSDGSQDRDNCPLISKETERGASDPEITYTARRDGIHYLLISGVGGEIGTYTVEVR